MSAINRNSEMNGPVNTVCTTTFFALGFAPYVREPLGPKSSAKNAARSRWSLAGAVLVPLTAW